MSSILDKDDVLNKAKKLNGRETAAVLAVLQSHIPSIIINNDSNYLSKVIDENVNNREYISDLLNNIQSVLISDKDLEWVKSSNRIAIWFYNYTLAEGGGILPNLCINNNSSFIDNLIAGFDCNFFRVMLPSPNPPFSSANNFPIQYNAFQAYPVKTQYSHLATDMNKVLNNPSHTINSVGVNPTLSNNIADEQQNSTDIEKATKTSLFSQFNFVLESKSTFLINAKILHNLVYTTHEYTSWIKTEDYNQLYWAWNYLDKAGMLLKHPLFLAQNNEDLFAQICASLDAFDNNYDLSHPYNLSTNKKYFISNMRKAWSQKKFRDKKDAESAQEYFLTRRHMNRLKKLASDYGVSSAEYLQQLIDDAFDKTE